MTLHDCYDQDKSYENMLENIRHNYGKWKLNKFKILMRYFTK